MSGHAGIAAWMSGIRTTMVNDPGRQLLEDQIQSTGFLFLEDYLENILDGPRHDPFIELVKTPGRRKIVATKSKSATSKDKLNEPKLMELDMSPEKENAATTSMAPISMFHKALLQSRNENVSGPERSSEKPAPKGSEKTKKSAKKKAAASKIKLARSAVEDEVEHIITDEEVDAETRRFNSELAPSIQPLITSEDTSTPVYDLAPLQQEPPKPSIIQEVDERSARDRSTPQSKSKGPTSDTSTSLPSSHSNKSSSILKRLPDDIDMANVMDLDDVTQVTMKYNVSSSISGQSFSTVPLDSPVATKTLLAVAEELSPEQSIIVSPDETDHTSARIGIKERLDEPKSTLQEEDAFTTPVSETIHFAGIGQPSPLRKSMRPPKDSTVHLPVAKSSMPTHSSWLIKSKEKAAENNAKKSLAPAATALLVNKRKSGEMLETHSTEISEVKDGGRSQKITKLAEASPSKLKLLKDHEKTFFDRFHDEAQPVDAGDGDIITRLKEQVAGYSARAGKSMGKSLGGAAASALAEARAAAEAKIAERHAAEGRQVVAPALVAVEPVPVKPPGRVFVRQPSSERVFVSKTETDRRLSVSELVTDKEVKSSFKGFEGVFHAPPKGNVTPSSSQDVNKAANTSTSTTPPHSPPLKPRSPVFRPPQKVLPVVASASKPAAALALKPDAKEPEPIRGLQPLTSQASVFSTQSTFFDPVFDSQVRSWVPSTQGTEFEDHAPFHTEHGYEQKFDDHDSDMDAEESWHLDEKFGETWTPVIVGMKDDSMTWSTAPTRSTREADTGELVNSIPAKKSKKQSNTELKKKASSLSARTQSTGDEAYESAKDEEEADMDVDGIEEAIPTVRLVTPSTQRTGLLPFFNKTHSPAMEAGSGGFFSSATKLMSSVLGGSKKGKEPVKSLQLAAAVAKKQHEEAEKKAVRIKEMETRRQQVIQKKVEEGKARDEKKAKEEEERRRREEKEKEKENLTEKKVLRHQGKTLTQMESEASKKRKEADKETTTTKPPAKDQKEALVTKIGKLMPSSSQASSKPTVSALKKPAHPSMGLAKSGGVKAAVSAFESKQTTTATSKDKGKSKEVEVVIKQSSKAAQAEMQARYQAQLMEQEAANAKHKLVESTENIELPDINSEYSNSDDEDHVKTFDPPHWAQSPALRAELELQSTMNPDDIFGAIQPLNMEELFKSRSSRFRPRTSSANWAGTDELTAYEEIEYARRMGFK